MNDHTLTEQQLEELRPLAAVIEGAIKDTPIRLGTDDWGTMLAAGILVRVAAYMGGVLPPVTEPGDWLTRGTRDLSIPDQAPAADEDACLAHREGCCDGTTRDCAFITETGRANVLRVLVDRAARGVLNDHEATALRARAQQVINGRAMWKAKAEEIERDRDRIAAELEQAQAAIERVREVTRRLANHAVGFQDVLDDSDRDPWAKTIRADIAALCAALDGTEQPTTEA